MQDAAARRAAVTDFEHNLVVLAGAGTGKTSLLVERFLNAVGSGRAGVEQIAAITFTEKAAAEMRRRVAEGLDELRARASGRTPTAGGPAERCFLYLCDELGVSPAEIERRSLEALEALDRSRVLTIHGLCSEILRGHPIEAGVDPDFAVDTGERGRTIAEATWEEYLGEELGPSSRRAAAWTELLGSAIPLEKLGQTAKECASFRVPLGLLDEGAQPAAVELLGGEARRLAAEIESALVRARGLTPTYESFLPRMRSALRTFLERGSAACRSSIRADPLLMKRLEDSAAKPGKKTVPAEEMRELYRDAHRLGRVLSRLDEALPRRLAEVAEPFARRVREALLAQGWVGFDGLLALARDLLRDHPEVRGELKRRFRILLVDEFQDTDPLQYEIVLLLAEHVEECSPDPWSTRLEPGKLFVVGDPKQSIYRFRGADYAAFRAAVERVLSQGGRSLTLTANFRGVPAVTAPIDLLFGAASRVWRESPYQPAYETIEPMRPATGGGPRVELWTLTPGEGSTAAARRRLEGRQIAAEVERLVGEGAARYRDITILFRTFGSIPYYLRPLRERGIPFVVDGGKEFLKRPEISQSLAALRALAQPADPVALLAFLRSPAGGVSDRELAAYASTGAAWDWHTRPTAAGQERIAACFDLLRRLERAMRTLPVDAQVQLVLEETRSLPLAAAAYEGPQRVANLQKLGEAAGRLARDGRLSLEEVVDTLQEGGLADLETDSPLADDRAEALHITSIHKMKGLESEWIFLPDLAREDAVDRRNPRPVEIVRTEGRPPALALRLDTERFNPAWGLHDLEQERHEDAEETRVLYVALTRARERIVLLAARARSEGLWMRALSAWGYDMARPPEDGALLAGGFVRHVARSAAVAAAPLEPLEQSGLPGPVAAYREALERAGRESHPPFLAPSAEGEVAADSLALTPSRRPRDLGSAVGLAVHRVLYRWDGRETGRLRGELERASADAALDHDLDPQQVERETREVLERFLASPLGPRFRRVERVARELPLLLRGPHGATYRGNIDLLYRDEDGSLVVADYKTDSESDPTLLRARHGEQMRIYVEAVALALGASAPPRAELWMLRSGERIAIT